MERVKGDGDGAIVEELTYTSKDSKGIKDEWVKEKDLKGYADKPEHLCSR